MIDFQMVLGAALSVLGAAIVVGALSYAHWVHRAGGVAWQEMRARLVPPLWLGLVPFSVGGAMRAPSVWETVVWVGIGGYATTRAWQTWRLASRTS